MMPADLAPTEPSVLDWVKSVLRGRPIPIPEPAARERAAPLAAAPVRAAVPRPAEARAAFSIRVRAVHLRVPLALVVLLVTQIGLQRWTARSETPWPWILALVIGLGLLLWAAIRQDMPLEAPTDFSQARAVSPVRAPYLAAGAILSLAAFLLSGGNTFRTPAVIAWAASVTCVLLGFWEGEDFLHAGWRRLTGWLRHPRFHLAIDGWAVAIWLVLGVALVYRFLYLDRLMIDMWSDQAEKLLDVMDILAGRTSIFFIRNTGREPLQIYLTAAIARYLGTGFTFLTLKLGTALAGWLTLPFLYLFAREFAGRRVALAAMFLAGIAFWPNLLARTGLRFALLPLFAAPSLYFLVRGLGGQRRNDILLAGLFAGIGLYGYSPARVVPLILALGVLVYIAHPVARGRRTENLLWLGAAAVVAFAVFVPLAHSMLVVPDYFFERMLTRLTSAEQPLPGHPLVILVGNVWNALKMFNWDSGNIWVVSLLHMPILDWVTGALFLCGVLLTGVRYARHRSWFDLFLLLSIPLWMTPSILSLAFPSENPAPNRAGGVMIPAFTLAGFGLVSILTALRRAWPQRGGWIVAAGAGAALLALAMVNNYRMLFVDFAEAYRTRSWNTSDAGRIVRGFAESVGSYETAHVIPYPFWMDTRLVAFEAGRPGYDYALPPETIDTTSAVLEPQLFLVNVDDADSMTRLNELFPEGEAELFQSGVAGHDFWVYFVPRRSQAQ